MSIILDEYHEYCLFGRIYGNYFNDFLFGNFRENAMEISVVNGDYYDRK